ncbi:MAG: PLP-dependent transferase [bacterium]|nr:PLP-dependent transferase [bacterium]
MSGFKTVKRESVGAWIRKNYASYDGNVTPLVRDAEHTMVEEFLDLGVTVPPRGYKRYGYALSNLVAHLFADRVGALGLGFEARLTNCGMAAIATALEVIPEVYDTTGAGICIAGKVMYPETPKLIAVYVDEEASLEDSGDLKGLLWFCEEFQGPYIMFFETLGNGPSMPLLDVRGLFDAMWDREVVIVLDNTLLTCALLNPFEIYARIKGERGNPVMKFVYVESLSKYYRVDENDPVTAGIIVASPKVIAECDEIIARMGTYLQFPCLRELPFDLYGACKATMSDLSLRTGQVVASLRSHPKVKSVAYPDSLSGGVFFFTVDGDSSEVKVQMEREFGPSRGSFGHAESTWLPFGDATGGDPHVFRFAVGVNDSGDEVIAKLKRALDYC